MARGSFSFKFTPSAEVARRLKEKALKKITAAQQSLTPQLEQKLGRPLVKEIVDTVQRGLSPVAGQGRFPRYKNPARYPGKLKPQRPVNLTLTGRFLASLRALGATFNPARTIHKMRIGFDSKYARDLEQFHTDGSQPHRQVIPSESQKLTAPLIKFARDLYLRLLRDKL